MKCFGCLSAAFIVSFAVQSNAQTTLTDIFRDLHSTDPKIRAQANSTSIETLKRELPTISTETSTICTALGDSDDYIRQQASAILSVLVQLYPQDVAVVSACTKQLLVTGLDPVPQTRQNSLLALGMKSDGPPAEAAHDFEVAVDDPSIEYKQLGAYGIMQLPNTASASKKHLAQALSASTDSESRQALLMGTAQSRKTNTDVAASIVGLLSDKSPEIQNAAVLAFESSSPSKTNAINVLQNYKQADALSPHSKQAADAAIQRLQASIAVQK